MLRSYVVLTEEGRLLSHNHVHLHHTNVPFQPSRPYVQQPPVLSPNKNNTILPTNKPSKGPQVQKPDHTGPPASPHKPVQSPPMSMSTPPRT